MSFILDALKKADAERHLGELPGLHAASLPAASVTSVARRAWRRPIIAIVVLGMAAATLSVVRPWQRQESGAPASPQAAGAASMPAIASATVSTPAVVTPVMPAPTPPMPPAVPAATRPPATEVPAPAPLPVPLRPVTRPPGAAAVPPTTAAVPATVKPQNAANAGMGEKVPPVSAMSLAQLPPAVRGELPAMAIGGSMYSANPADRMLLVDKRMLHEGDEIAPGLLLESIQQKSAIVRYKGFVFRLPF